MSTQIFIPTIYGGSDETGYFSDIVGVYFTEGEAYQALYNKLCHEKYLATDNELDCKDEETLKNVCQQYYENYNDETWINWYSYDTGYISCNDEGLFYKWKCKVESYTLSF